MRVCGHCGEVYRGEVAECPMCEIPLQAWVDTSRPTDPMQAARPEGRRAQAHELPLPAMRTQLEAGQLDAPRGKGKAPAASPHDAEDWDGETEAAPESVRVIGDRYALKKQLGVGGFGAVYEAEDQRLKKKVAIKLLSPKIAQNEEALVRFQREAIAASQVGHEGIIDVTDSDRDADGTYFIAMEFLNGCDLAQTIEEESAENAGIDPVRALRIAVQAADALAAAHSEGIIHRDLKPANVYITKRKRGGDRVKIIDFGISKVMHADLMDGGNLTDTGQILGTPYYMSPEQATGKHPIDARCDVYALGIILYEMLTGVRPFRGRTFVELITAHMTEVPASPSSLASLPPQLDAIVLKALEKDPADRFADMTAMHDALEAALVAIDGPQQVRASTVPPPGARPGASTGENPALMASTFGHASGQMDAAPAVSEIKPPTATGSKRIAIGVGAALAAAAAVFLVLRATGGDKADSPAAAAPPPTADTTGGSDTDNRAIEPPSRPSTTTPAAPPRKTVVAPTTTVMVEPAEVRVTAKPRARLYVDGKLLGRTPRTVKLKTGQTARIELKKSGYETIERRIGAADGPKLALSLTRVSKSAASKSRSKPKTRASSTPTKPKAASAKKPKKKKTSSSVLPIGLDEPPQTTKKKPKKPVVVPMMD